MGEFNQSKMVYGLKLLPGFVSFINEVIDIIEGLHGKFRQILDIRS